MKEIDQTSSTTSYGYILVPRGTPKHPNLYHQKCLPIAFAIATMVSEAAQEGKAPLNKLLFQLRSLSQRKKASNKEKNAIGDRIWARAQEQLDRVCSPSTGPFSYALLDTLCKTFNYQAVIFSGLLPTPVYVYPLEQEGEPRQDLPCLFFQEVVSLNPESPTTRHLQVILRP